MMKLLGSKHERRSSRTCFFLAFSLSSRHTLIHPRAASRRPDNAPYGTNALTLTAHE